MKHPIETLRARAEFRIKARNKETTTFSTMAAQQKRLFEELDYVYENGGAEALLLLSDLVRKLKRDGITGSFGTGYTCDSYLCFGIGITEVDSLKWALPFSTFGDNFFAGNQLALKTSCGGFAKVIEFLDSSRWSYMLDENDAEVLHIMMCDDYQYDCLSLRIIEDALFEGLNINEFGIVDDKKIEAFSALHPELPEAKCLADICLLNTIRNSSFDAIRGEVYSAMTRCEISATGIREVDSILINTFGFVIYQEQIDLIASVLKHLPSSPQKRHVQKMLDAAAERGLFCGATVADTMVALIS